VFRKFARDLAVTLQDNTQNGCITSRRPGDLAPSSEEASKSAVVAWSATRPRRDADRSGDLLAKNCRRDDVRVGVTEAVLTDSEQCTAGDARRTSQPDD